MKNDPVVKEKPIYEDQEQESVLDPQAVSIRDRRLITQPYDLVIEAIISQIKQGTLHIRPLSGRPKFQRGYVWSDELASRFVESILLNVPIPPAFFPKTKISNWM